MFVLPERIYMVVATLAFMYDACAHRLRFAT
jgi:hypothetical protein